MSQKQHESPNTDCVFSVGIQVRSRDDTRDFVVSERHDLTFNNFRRFDVQCRIVVNWVFR